MKRGQPMKLSRVRTGRTDGFLGHPRLRPIAVLGATIGVLVFTTAPAVAAPETPANEKVKEVTATTATFEGELNPKAPPTGAEPGEYTFEYAQSEENCEGQGYIAEGGEFGMALGFPGEDVS